MALGVMVALAVPAMLIGVGAGKSLFCKACHWERVSARDTANAAKHMGCCGGGGGWEGACAGVQYTCSSILQFLWLWVCSGKSKVYGAECSGSSSSSRICSGSGVVPCIPGLGFWHARLAGFSHAYLWMLNPVCYQGS
jgi:hypothetical protein